MTPRDATLLFSWDRPMQLARVRRDETTSVAVVEGERVRLLEGVATLSSLLHAAGPGDAVRAAVARSPATVAPDLRIVGYTIGNDMSSRDIEGENPLYLPQAKVYDGSCALGPVVTLAEALPPAEQVTIRLVISRGGQVAFEGATTLAMMARK